MPYYEAQAAHTRPARPNNQDETPGTPAARKASANVFWQIDSSRPWTHPWSWGRSERALDDTPGPVHWVG